MTEQIWLSHLQEIALVDDWVKVTDMMGREYRIDPHAAMELAIWIAEHHEAVVIAQATIDLARRMEEAALYGPLLDINMHPEDPLDPPSSGQPLPSSGAAPRKKRRRTPRKGE